MMGPIKEDTQNEPKITFLRLRIAFFKNRVMTITRVRILQPYFVIVIYVYCAQNILSMLWSYDADYIIIKEHMHQPLFTITW